MWSVLEKKQLSRVLKKAPKQVLVRYEAWKRTVELLGPQGLKEIRGFNDEALSGNWNGFRSSRLGKQWRVIYKVDGKGFQVFVVEITPHKY